MSTNSALGLFLVLSTSVGFACFQVPDFSDPFPSVPCPVDGPEGGGGGGGGVGGGGGGGGPTIGPGTPGSTECVSNAGSVITQPTGLCGTSSFGMGKNGLFYVRCNGSLDFQGCQ